jgi:YesN/AraC family two-component response regulator
MANEDSNLDALPRLLIVDDEADNLTALKRLLRKDFEVLTAEDGPNGLRILEEEEKPFDCILSDQRMPGMTGSEFFERVQKIDEFTTRILISGFSDLEAVIDAVNRGHIWQYVAKPWEPEELKKTLLYATERTKLRRRLEDSRRELERAATELRAKDWARERLLGLLLHEFRNMPQIVSSVRELNEDPSHVETRAKFLGQLEKRFERLSHDIESLMKEEKEVSLLAKNQISLLELAKSLEGKASLDLPQNANEDSFAFRAPEGVLRKALEHLIDVLKKNSAAANVTLSLERMKNAAGFFLLLTIPGRENTLLPQGLQKSALASQTAWTALLEPFVGAEDFQHHDGGLRVETARIVRQLAALGIRAAFDFTSPQKDVVLLLHFQ